MMHLKIALALGVVGSFAILMGGFGMAWIRFSEGLGAIGGGSDPAFAFWNMHPLRWLALKFALWAGFAICLAGVALVWRSRAGT